jgi:hypothetical protein
MILSAGCGNILTIRLCIVSPQKYANPCKSFNFVVVWALHERPFQTNPPPIPSQYASSRQILSET